MKTRLLLALRVTPLVLCLGIVFGLPSSAPAAGKVTTSVELPAAGAVDMDDSSQVMLAGTVYVVSQVLKTSDGDLLAGLHINHAELHGMGTDDMEWVGVGGKRVPLSPVLPRSPVIIDMEFSLIPLGIAPAPAPSPIAPPTVQLTLVFDFEGNLLAAESEAIIRTGR